MDSCGFFRIPPMKNPIHLLGADGVFKCVRRRFESTGPDHAAGVAADVEDRAFLQPFPEFLGLLDDAVLDVDFLGLVAAEGGGQFGQDAALQVVVEFLLIEEVGCGTLVAIKQPCSQPQL